MKLLRRASSLARLQVGGARWQQRRADQLGLSILPATCQQCSEPHAIMAGFRLSGAVVFHLADKLLVMRDGEPAESWQ